MVRKVGVGVRLFILAAIALLSTIIVGTFGYFGIVKMDEQAELMYHTAALPTAQLGSMNGAVGKIVADLLLAFHHDPASRFASIHSDHSIAEHFESAETWRKHFESNWEAFKKTDRNADETRLSVTIETHYKSFITKTYEPIIAKLRAGEFSESVVADLLKGFKADAELVEKNLTELIAMEEKIAAEANKEATEIYHNTVIQMIVVVVIAIAIMVAGIWAIVSSITGPLTRIQAMTEEIEHTGDFRKRIQVRANDEVGKTGNIINDLIDSLQKAFTALLRNTEQLDKASAELAELSGRVASASEKTSDSSSDMAASVEEMTASITQVGENAKETSKNAESVMELSQSGATIVNKTVAEMQNMSRAVQSSSETIAELGKQSEQISGIVQTIKDVADQTNLLALNAAIEAARAGEQGRGFAVVADEIRKLAERTTSATTEIAAMISAIQESAHTAVASMTHAATMVSEGVSLAEQAGEAINKIAHGANQAQVRVADITAALSEQSSASHQIAEQVEKVAQATDENSEAAKSSATAADNIAKLAVTMRETMARFKV